MGIDVYGILFYGIPIGNKYDWKEYQNAADEAEKDGEDLYVGDFVQMRLLPEITPPEREYPEGTRDPNQKSWNANPIYTEEEKEIVKEYHDYWDRRNRAMDEIPISVKTASTYDDPYLYISINEAEFSADWGEFEHIPTEKLFIKPEWDEILKESCEKLGIKYEQPKWYLTALYSH